MGLNLHYIKKTLQTSYSTAGKKFKCWIKNIELQYNLNMNNFNMNVYVSEYLVKQNSGAFTDPHCWLG
jgi:hypothetical protein